MVGAYSYLTATKQEHQQQPTLKLSSFFSSCPFLDLFLFSIFFRQLLLSILSSSSPFLLLFTISFSLSFPFHHPFSTFLQSISFAYLYMRLSFLSNLCFFSVFHVLLCGTLDLSVKPAKIISAVLNFALPVKFVTYMILVLSFCQVNVQWEKKGSVGSYNNKTITIYVTTIFKFILEISV